MTVLVDLSDTRPAVDRSDDHPTTAVSEECLRRLVAARRSGDVRVVHRCEAEVVERYRPYADRLARRFRGRGVEDDDLMQEARLGLCKAVRRWCPELDPTLLQFATPTIEGQVKQYFRDHCRPIRMPRSVQEDLALHQDVQEELTQTLGRHPTEAEVAAAAGSSIERVQRQRLASRVCQPMSVDSAPAAIVAGLRCEEASRSLASVEDSVSVGAAIRDLPARHQRILALRFADDLSQAQIAARTGVSQMQISRLLRTILTRLREQLR